jgi:hypothetical protein
MIVFTIYTNGANKGVFRTVNVDRNGVARAHKLETACACGGLGGGVADADAVGGAAEAPIGDEGDIVPCSSSSSSSSSSDDTVIVGQAGKTT